jgi:hypothetical protein
VKPEIGQKKIDKTIFIKINKLTFALGLIADLARFLVHQLQ